MPAKKPVSEARFAKLLQPVLDAIQALGGSARPAEVKEWILGALKVSEEYATAVHKGSGESKFGNDVDWARFYLVRTGYLDSSKRGVWTLTEKGRTADLTPEEIAGIIRTADLRGPAVATAADSGPIEPPTKSYVEAALTRLWQLPPKGFENLCQRLLRESGFEEVVVTGRSGDGGIDGHGILKINAFVSFRVLFQCKRYKGVVSPDKVRDFRGAMVGRADKGILLTTGHFSPQAESEASRDGAQPIELVDGEALVKLLADLELGLIPKQDFELDESFFQQFETAKK